MTTFSPAYGNNKPLALTTSSQNVLIPKGSRAVLVQNPDPVAGLWFNVTAVARAATTADCYVRPNSERLVSVPDDAVNVAVIGSAAGTVNAQIIPGGLLEP